MPDEMSKPRSMKWLYVVVALLVVLGAAFVGGWWLAGASQRGVAAVTDSYTAVYGGSDSTKDGADLLPLYATDAVLRDAATDRTYEGTSEIKDALDALLVTPDFDLTVERTLVGDDWAMVFWTADGTNPDDGRLAQVKGLTALEISKGKIDRETWYYDPAKAPF